MRLRAAHAVDAKEGKRKAKSKKGKAKQVFTEVGAGTAVEALTTYSDEEDEGPHFSSRPLDFTTGRRMSDESSEGEGDEYFR